MKTIKNIKELSKLIKTSKKYIIIYMLLSLLISLVGIITPLLSARQLVSITTNNWINVILIALFIFLVSILRSIINLAIVYISEKFSKLIIRQLQLDMAKEILNIKVENLDKHSNGLFIQRMTTDVIQLTSIFTFGVESVTSLLVDLGIFIVIYFINIWVGIYLTIFLIIFFIFGKIKIKVTNKLDKKYRDQRESTSGFATEIIRGVRDIKMLNAKKSFLNSIQTSVNTLNDDSFKLRMTRSLFSLVSNTLYSLYDLGLVILLVFLIINNHLTLASALIVYNYKYNVSSFITWLSHFLDYIRDFNLSFDRVIEIFNGNNFSKETFGTKHLKHIKGDFEFKNVEFSYGENKVLKDTSFKVNANETVAFVGKSGVGKTTIFNLLCKMYEITKGEILIDGININELDEDSIRGNITIISQNPYIFNKSIRENLKLVKNDLTDEEMIKACKMACLDEYIESLENKYDTIIGEGGVNLSGGQRQRLAIARSLIQKTEIILFDEATSALDNETQEKIQTSINNMKGEYTILIIAHRLSTIINCDRILYIEDGKIIAEGRHEELLKTNKQYRNLYLKEQKQGELE